MCGCEGSVHSVVIGQGQGQGMGQGQGQDMGMCMGVAMRTRGSEDVGI